MNSEKVVKGKRGRKPRDATNNILQEKAKRGRKPKMVYNMFDKENILNQSDDENIIMKLNLPSNLEFNQTEDQLPDGYSTLDCNFSYLSNDEESVDEQDSYCIEDCLDEPVKCNVFKVFHLLKDFREKNKQNDWPSSTSISCYWCCHNFKTPPFGIPVKYIDGVFSVYGCFCSLECAAAYNIDSKDSMDEMWEKHTLINLLSRKIDYKPFIKPAPSRLCLNTFGGYMGIEEFRRYTDFTKLVNLTFPPMMTMVQQIEEINASDINNDFKYIPIDNDRINKYKETMKLKRTKPVNDYKNTLDHSMNLKFGH